MMTTIQDILTRDLTTGATDAATDNYAMTGIFTPQYTSYESNISLSGCTLSIVLL